MRRPAAAEGSVGGLEGEAETWVFDTASFFGMVNSCMCAHMRVRACVRAKPLL